ncbi:MAG: hypothetical protein IID45_14360 [Planctomycetes bacterium]|nr:hypothetical protein [Planctomycetota bacterium]
MLSNRADIYNLGEIIGESADVFEMSYLENSLTSNSALNTLATRSQKDVYAVIKMAQADAGNPVAADELEGNYSLEELNEMVAVMTKLIRIRDVILTVNKEYIRSAAQSDDYRTEPPFKLQGSYRNMNRMAEKVVPIMNDDELEALILSNYENDAQTLPSDTEANLLKLKELTGHLTDVEAKRWADIKRTFQKNVKMRGIDTSDKAGQVIAQLSTFSDGLDSIRDALSEGVGQLAAREEETDDSAEREHIEQQVHRLAEQLQGLRDGLLSIEGSLEGGITRLEEFAAERSAREAAVVAAAQPVAPAFDADAIRELAAEIREMSTPIPPAPFPLAKDSAGKPKEDTGAVTSESLPSRITIVNKIPPTLLKVLEQQFNLMQGWMAPILAATNAQSAEMQELRNQIDSCLTDYGKLVKRVGTARKTRRKPQQPKS